MPVFWKNVTWESRILFILLFFFFRSKISEVKPSGEIQLQQSISHPAVKRASVVAEPQLLETRRK